MKRVAVFLSLLLLFYGCSDKVTNEYVTNTIYQEDSISGVDVRIVSPLMGDTVGELFVVDIMFPSSIPVKSAFVCASQWGGKYSYQYLYNPVNMGKMSFLVHGFKASTNASFYAVIKLVNGDSLISHLIKVYNILDDSLDIPRPIIVYPRSGDTVYSGERFDIDLRFSEDLIINGVGIGSQYFPSNAMDEPGRRKIPASYGIPGSYYLAPSLHPSDPGGVIRGDTIVVHVISR